MCTFNARAVCRCSSPVDISFIGVDVDEPVPGPLGGRVVWLELGPARSAAVSVNALGAECD